MMVVRTNSGDSRDGRIQIYDAVDGRCSVQSIEPFRQDRSDGLVDVEVDGHDARHPWMSLDRGADRPGSLVVPGRRGLQECVLANSNELGDRVTSVGSRRGRDERVGPVRMGPMTGTVSETGSACHGTEGNADDDGCEDCPGEWRDTHRWER